MKQLINPAIALMNRLPMVYKFSLISILFLLPIGGLSWLAISELNRSVQTMTRGVEGLEQLQQVDQPSTCRPRFTPTLLDVSHL